MPIPVEFIKKYNTNKVCVETGTFRGQGIGRFLSTKMFDKIFSIDINPDYVNAAKHLYKKYPEVEVICGDSGVVMKDTINNISGGITFWLDAHHCGADSGCAKEYVSPIQKELDIIKEHPDREKHIIMIDDINYFSQQNIDVNIKRHPTKDPGYILKENLIMKLKEINPTFEIEFFNIENGVCVARPPPRRHPL